MIYMIKTQSQQIFKNEVLRYPRLDTILMIEDAMREYSATLTLRAIWEHLPKKVMWQTFITTLEYLAYSGKIYMNEKKKKAVWIWNPQLLERVKHEGVEV